MSETEVKLPIFYKFPKEEKLTSKKEIESLFKSGKTLFSFPYKIFFCFADKEEEHVKAKVLITVPKRQFKKAVDRNRIKRLFREAYRKNKFKLDLSTSNKPLLIAFLYVHTEIVSHVEIEKKVKQILVKINQQITL